MCQILCGRVLGVSKKRSATRGGGSVESGLLDEGTNRAGRDGAGVWRRRGRPQPRRPPSWRRRVWTANANMPFPVSPPPGHSPWPWLPPPPSPSNLFNKAALSALCGSRLVPLRADLLRVASAKSSSFRPAFRSPSASSPRLCLARRPVCVCVATTLRSLLPNLSRSRHLGPRATSFEYCALAEWASQ